MIASHVMGNACPLSPVGFFQVANDADGLTKSKFFLSFFLSLC